MPQPLPPVTPIAPDVDLLTSANPIPGLNADGWSTGVAARDDTTIPSFRWPRCQTDPDAEKPEIDNGDIDTFAPFTVGAVAGCTGRADYTELRASAVAALAAKQSWEIAREVWTGATTGNPSLQSAAVDATPTPGTAVGVVAAARVLLAGYEECTRGSRAFLHVPSTAMHALVDGSVAKRVGNRFLTPAGHVVVPGPGYPNTAGDWGPIESDGPLPAADGELWLYVSGPVEVSLGDPTELGSGRTPVGAYARQNRTEVIYERDAIYRFPTGCVAAVLADLD